MTNSENENESNCVFFFFENDMLPWHTKCWQPQWVHFHRKKRWWRWWWTLSLVYTFAIERKCVFHSFAFCSMRASLKWTVNVVLCVEDVGESRSFYRIIINCTLHKYKTDLVLAFVNLLFYFLCAALNLQLRFNEENNAINREQTCILNMYSEEHELDNFVFNRTKTKQIEKMLVGRLFWK